MNTAGGEFPVQQSARRSSSAASPTWQPADFSTAGQRLRARREALGIPVEAIARKTRMPRRTVERIEADDYDAIGAEFYVRGFIKLYAEHLGMPAAPLIETYESQHALVLSTDSDESMPQYFQGPAEPTRSLGPAQVFLLVVCAATLLGFMMSVQKQRGARSVAKRPAISAPGTPATAHRPTVQRAEQESPTAADAVGQ